MAKQSPVIKLLSSSDRERLDADVMTSDLSWRDLGKKYGIAHTSVRAYAIANGIVRNASGLKRAIVADAMARATPGESERQNEQSVRRSDSPATQQRAEIEEAAAADIKDMRLGLQCARAALTLVGKKLQNAAGPAPTVEYEPRELKTISEAIAINVTTIRVVRGLDTGIGIPDVSKLTDEQLDDVRRGRVPR